MANGPDPPRIAIYDPYLDARGGGEKYVLRFGEVLGGMARSPVTLLVHRNYDEPGLLDALRSYYGLALADFRIRLLGPAPASVATYLGFVRESRNYDVLVCLSNGVPKLSLAKHSVSIVQFPFRPATPSELAGWQKWILSRYEFVVYSRFVEGWLERRWDRRAVVISPPITLAPPPGPLEPKAKLILSVGRFFRGEHDKKHREMIAAFAALRAQGLAGWEFHLAGSVAPNHRAEFEEIRGALPPGVTLHPNAPLSEIGSLMSRASVYWHATGAGEDESLHPERMEHFGLTTGEAMAFGCVPVVIGRGGQPEIVRDRECGFLCADLGQMRERTLELVADPGLRDRLSGAARERIRQFDDAAFERSVHEWARRRAFFPEARELARGN